MKSAPTIAVDYRPSRMIALAGGAIVLLAAVAPLLTGWPIAPKLVVSLCALVAGMASVLRFARPPLRRIAYGADGWQLRDRERAHDAVLVTHARIGPFTALTWRLATGRRWHALLAPDNADAETRRRMTLVLARRHAGAERIETAR